jgi:hypothetical protein
LFECGSCTREAERVSLIVQAFRTQIPAVISASDVAGLRGRGLTIVDNEFAPGVRSPVTFDPGVDLLVHHLGGLDLSAAERVEVQVRTESGLPIFEELFAPFDRDRGEVLIACQRHYRARSARLGDLSRGDGLGDRWVNGSIDRPGVLRDSS